MKDPHIRHVLKQTELAKHIADTDTKVVEELPLPVAGARIDMAVINGAFHGYEIKSASDTLKRLPNQIESYSLVFDYLTVVTEDKYQEKILKIAPEWVGVSVCSGNAGNEEIVEVQPAQLNTKRDGFYIAKLLCKDEIIHILLEHQIKFRYADRAWDMCKILSNELDIETLSLSVRQRLKSRRD